MRQAGVLAAAGVVALETMVDRLPEDHARARRLAMGLRGVPGLQVEKDPPPSNMVYLKVGPQASKDAAGLEESLGREGIKIHAVGPDRIRLVVHYWVDDAGVDRTVAAFRSALA
jgi:threonine aldolase